MTCMYHKHPTPTSSMCQTNTIFSHSSLRSNSRAVSSQKPSNAILSACQQLINMDFIPRMSVCKIHTRLNRERLGNNMSRVGWGCRQRSVGWNVSSGESCSWGFSLSAQWCPLYRADTIWPAGMLLSRGWRGLLCCRGEGLWLRDVLTVVVLTI